LAVPELNNQIAPTFGTLIADGKRKVFACFLPKMAIETSSKEGVLDYKLGVPRRDERKDRIMMAAVFIGIKEVFVIMIVTAIVVSITVLRRRR